MKRIIAVCLAILMVGVVPVQAEKYPAKGAVLMEVSTGTVLFEHNSRAAMPLASVTKIMTMLLVMEAIDSGTLSWDDPVTASESAEHKGGSQIYLKAGETMTVRELMKAVAVSSANDAACALAEQLAGSEAAFVEKMNARAAELGMEQTHFVNCTGLDDAPEAQQHVSSAYDIALMSRELLHAHPSVRELTTIWMDTVRSGTFGLANTNKLVRFYDGCTGLKTGYTARAGFCLSASAQREDMQLVAVVLGCETSAERFSACRELLNKGFAGWCLIQNDQTGYPVPVRLGAEASVCAIPAHPGATVIDRGQKSTVRFQVELAESVTAPVSCGQRLGTLTVRAGEQILRQIPLLAQQAVERLSFGQIFLQNAKRVFCVQ